MEEASATADLDLIPSFLQQDLFQAIKKPVLNYKVKEIH